MRNIPTPLAVVIILAAIVIAVLVGVWYLNRSPAPIKEEVTLSPVSPGTVQPQQGERGQGAQPVTPTY